jgi:osmotically-inducible protein OsmY
LPPAKGKETVMSQAIRKSDAQIHHDVLEELKWDSRVDETEVGVQVDGGVVTRAREGPNVPRLAFAQC